MNYIYGRKILHEVVKNFPEKIKEVYIDKGLENFGEDLLKLKSDLSIHFVNKNESTKFFDQPIDTQGVVAKVTKYKYLEFEDILKLNEKNVLILDKIQDPHNFGAIIRTSVAFGIKNIIMLDRKQVEVTPVVMKTSAGNLYGVNICKVNNLSNAITKLKENGYWVYASYLSDKSKDIKEIDFSTKNAIIIGNENNGVSQLVANNADEIFKIKTQVVESLNVSNAYSIIAWTITN